jgi:Transposase, Mutator family
VSAYVDAHAEEVDENGHRLVVRNGHHNEREVITAAGPVPVRAPRVNDKRTDPATGERKRFASAILPAWARKSPRVAEVLPLLYLHGLSSSDFGPALTQFLGTSHGLSAATITRLTKDWQDEATTFNKRSLAGTDYVYCWVDGIHLKVRLEQDKVCLLVMIGVRADGTKEPSTPSVPTNEPSARGRSRLWGFLTRMESSQDRGHASPAAGLPSSLPIDFRWQTPACDVADRIARIVCPAQRLGTEFPAPCQGEGRGFESRRPLHKVPGQGPQRRPLMRVPLRLPIPSANLVADEWAQAVPIRGVAAGCVRRCRPRHGLDDRPNGHITACGRVDPAWHGSDGL